MAQNEDFERLHDVYAKAWAVRGSAGADEILTEGLDGLEGVVFAQPGPGRDLVLDLWERGVPPEALKRGLRRAVPGLARAAMTSWGEAAGLVAGYLRDGGSGDAREAEGEQPEQ